MSSNEFRSFAFTIRPKDGVPEDSDLEKSIINYVAKYKGFVCYEKEDVARHLHAQIFFEKPKRKYDVNKQLNLICTRTVKDWDLDQQHVLHGGTKIAYNDDWYLNYCNKEDTVFLYKGLPDDTVEYYPSISEQQKVMARSHAVDKTFHHLKEMYEEDPFTVHGISISNPSEEQVKKWFYHQMYVKKSIKVIEDKRKFNQRACSLYHYLPSETEKYTTF